MVQMNSVKMIYDSSGTEALHGVDLEINDSIYWEDPHASIQQSADYLRAFLPER